MATISEQRTQNLAAATLLSQELADQLALASMNGDLISVIVPVQFTVAVQANPGSSKTTEELRTLASNSGFQLYEP